MASNSSQVALQEFLRQRHLGGQWNSSGRFSLDLHEAKSRLSCFGVIDPAPWTLKLLQYFTSLGCSQLAMESRPQGWWFRATGARRGLDVARFHRSLAATALCPGQTCEKFLALAAVGLSAWPVRSVSYTQETGAGRFVVADLFCDNQSVAVAPSGVAEILLEVNFGPGPRPRFPLFLWRRSVAYCPMSVHIGGRCLNPRGSGQEFFAERGGLRRDGPYWLEAFLQGDGLAINPTGRADQVLGATLPLERTFSHTTSRVRWVETQAQTGLQGSGGGFTASLAILVRPLLRGPSRFHPILAGAPLQTFHLPGFPDGMEVVFDAAGLATDDSQFHLLPSPELSSRLQQILEQVKQCISLLERQPALAPVVLESQKPRRYLLTEVMILVGCANVGILSRCYWNNPPLLLAYLLLALAPQAFYFLNVRRALQAAFEDVQRRFLHSLQRVLVALDSCRGRDFPASVDYHE